MGLGLGFGLGEDSGWDIVGNRAREFVEFCLIFSIIFMVCELMLEVVSGYGGYLRIRLAQGALGSG